MVERSSLGSGSSVGEKLKQKTSLDDFLIVILFIYLNCLDIFFNISPTMESSPRLAEESRAYTQIAERYLSHQVSTLVNLLVHFLDSHTTTPPLSPALQSKSLVLWKCAHLMEAVDKEKCTIRNSKMSQRSLL